MWTREMLKTDAKHVLKRNYWIPFVVCLLISLLCGDFNPSENTGFHITYEVNNVQDLGQMIPFLPITIPFYLIPLGIFIIIGSILLNLFVFNPLKVGKARFFIQNIEQEATIGEVFKVFSTPNYLNVVKIMFLKDIKTILWTLCLIIPGIIKSYEYYMIPYILAENSSLSSEDVFSITRELTTNQKMDIFVLNLSFIGWYILGGFLFGIGTLFVNPYAAATEAELYHFLKYNAVYTSE